MTNLTPMQNLVSKAWNSYPDRDFIEMIEAFDVPEFWQDCIIEELTDDECIYVLGRLITIFREWNCA